LLNRPCANATATRLIIVQIDSVNLASNLAQSRRFALLAERVLEVISLKPEQMISAPSFADWLGLYRNTSLEAPQLIQPELLMPEELARLYALHNIENRAAEHQR
jgi:hypothetical protein